MKYSARHMLNNYNFYNLVSVFRECTVYAVFSECRLIVQVRLQLNVGPTGLIVTA